MGHNKQNQNKKAIKIALGIFLCSFVIFLWKTNFFYIKAQSNNAPINLSQEIQNRGITPIIENSNQEEAKKLESSNPIFDFFKNIQQRIEQQIQKPVDLEVKDNLPSTIDIQEIINKFKTNEDKEIEQNEPTDTQDDSEIPKIIDKIENNINQTETTTGSELQDKKTPSNIEDASSKLSNYISQKYFENELENSCGNQNNVIILEEGGHNLLPEYLSGDTFYILYGENYSFDYMLKITEDCTKILGKSGFTKLYTSNHEGATIKIISAKNTIIENIILEGEGDGFGGIHEKNNYGIYLASTGNFISNTQSYNQKRFAIYMEQPDNFTNLNSFFKHIIQKESDYNIEEITDGHVDDLSQTSDISTKTTNTIGEIKNLGKEANVVTTETIPKLKQIQEFSATNKPTKIKKDTKELESELIWNLFEKVEDKFVGKNPIDLSESDGKIPITLNLKSIDETIKVEIPKGTVFKTINNKNYTGVVISPQKAKNIGIGGSGSKIKSNSTFKVGSLEQKILLKDSKNDTDVYAKIEMELTGYKAGDMIPIYTSQDGEDWEYLGFFDVIEKDGKTIIDLETNHFSYISAGTHYGNYFKGSIQVTENFLSLNPLACHVSINGGVWQIAMMGINGKCIYNRSNTYGLSIKFRLTEKSGLDPYPREPIQLGDGDIGTLNTTTYQYGSNDTYYYDATAPSSSISPNGSTCSKGMSFSFGCSDGGVGCNSVHYKIIDGGMGCTDSGLSTISSGNAIGIAIPSGFEGTKKVCYKGVDRLGNSETIKTSNNFNIDNGQSTPSPIYPSAGGYVNTTRPTLTRNSNNLGCSSMNGYTVLFYYSTNCSTTPNVNWVTTESFTTSTLSNGSSYSWRVQGKDNLGNTSDLSTCRSFTVDTTLPTITINNPSTSPATSKTITASTNEGTLTMTAGSTSTTCNGTRTFVTYSSTTFSSEADNGKRICYRAVDAAGNIRYSLSNAIAGIDRTAPTGAPSCTANSYFSSSLAVTCTAGAGGTVVRYTTNGSNPTASSSIWSNQSFSSTTNLKAISCDALNNCNTSSITSRTYIKDTNAPSGGSFTINGGATHTKSTAVTLNVTCPTDAWTPIQVAYGNSASPTNRTSCTSSISHTLTSTNGSKTVYMRFRDGGNNTTSDTTKSIVLDTTAPTYVGYSNISGHSHVNGSDYWFKAGSELWIDITHSDNLGINSQYFGFNKSGCTPNNCGGAPDEIKSYNRSNIQTDWMTYDSHIDIYSSDCVDSDGSCTDNDLTRKRKSSIKSTIPDYDYRLNVYSYDFAANGVGYTNLGIWIKIDGTNPATSITSPSAGSRQNGSFNVSISDTDARSGIGTCRYRILDNGTQSLGWTSRTCNSTITINQSSYCSTQGTNKCTIESYSIDNVGNTSSTVSRSFSIDTIAPTITINNPNISPAQSKTISASTNEGTLTMSEGTSTTCNSTRTFSTYVSKTYSTESDNGRYVCYRAIDTAGNTTYQLSNQITGIDTTPPTLSATNNSNLRKNSSITTTLSVSDDNLGLAKFRWDNPDCWNGINFTDVTSLLQSTEGEHILYLCANDLANNTTTRSGSYKLDKTKPTVGASPAGGLFSGNILITLYGADTGSLLSYSKYSWISAANCLSNGTSYTNGAKITKTSEGPQTLYLCVGDNAGNINTANYTFTKDTTAPTGGNFTINGGDTHTNSTSVTINITCPTDPWTPIQVAYGNDNNPTNRRSCTNSIAHSLTDGNGNKTVYVRFRDGGGNTTSTINKTIVLNSNNNEITMTFTGDTPLNNASSKLPFSATRDIDVNTNSYIESLVFNLNGETYPIYNDGLILMLNFDSFNSIGEVGDVVDASKSNLPFTIMDATRTADGYYGGAFDFNGLLGAVATLQATDNTPINTDYISVYARIYPRSTYNNRSIVGRYNEAFRFLISNGNLETRLATTSGLKTNRSSFNIFPNQRTFVGFSYDGTKLKFYKNKEVQTIDASYGTINKPTQTIVIGGFNKSSDVFDGKIDEIFVYDRALSDEEMKIAYESNLKKHSSNKRFFTKHFDSLSDGLYNYKLIANDVIQADRNITIDTTTPTGGSFNISGLSHNSTLYTSNPTLSLNITCANDTGVGGVQIAYGDSVNPENRQDCTSSKTLTISQVDGIKPIYTRFKDALNNTTSNIVENIFLDTTGPNTPNIISPTNGENFDNGNIQLERGIANDTGIGLDKYNYKISTNSDFSNIILSEFTQNTGITIDLEPGVYYWAISAIDFLGNQGDRSETNNFEYIFDTEGPSKANIFAPSENQQLFIGKNQIQRSESIDDKSGLSGYILQISTDNFDSIKKSIFTIYNDYIEDFETTGNYQLRIISIDNVGNTTTGDSISINIQDDIIEYYFGSGSVFTKNRETNNCDTNDISIVYVYNYSGYGFFPYINLNSNRIYILQEGVHIANQTINFNGNCIALIGEQPFEKNLNTEIYSSVKLTNSIENFQNNNIIIDNLYINGTLKGNGGQHVSNNNGINFNQSLSNSIHNTTIVGFGTYAISYNGNKYGSIYNVNTYNNGYGLNIQSSNNNYLEGVNSINNTNGLRLTTKATHNLINNSKFINNSNIGLNIADSAYNTISNSLIGNNNLGVYVNGGTTHIFNSSIIQNNRGLETNLNGHVVSFNSNIIENVEKDISINQRSSTFKYYGYLRTNIIENNILSIGGIELSSIGYSSGHILYEKEQSSNNRFNIKDLSGIWNYNRDNFSYGHNQNLVPLDGIYSFGYNIQTKKTPTTYQGTKLGLTTFNILNSIESEFIASKTKKIQLSTYIEPIITTGATQRFLTIVGNNFNFSITGDILEENGGFLIDSIQTELDLTNNKDKNKITTQVRTDSSDGFTHQENIAIIDTTAPSKPENIFIKEITITTGVKIERTPSIDSGAGISGYIFELSNLSNFSNIIHSGEEADYTTLIEGLQETEKYFFRVKAIDKVQYESEWSNTFSFIITEEIENLVTDYYFGENNDFTDHWDDQCNTSKIQRIKVPNYNDLGQNTFPYSKLEKNTIYLLEEGIHILSEEIEFDGECIVLAGEGSKQGDFGKVKLYTSNTLTDMIKTKHNKGTIDNLIINGELDEFGSTHAYNGNGVSFAGVKNGGVFNSRISNISSSHIDIATNSSNIKISNLNIHNNGKNRHGIRIQGSNNNILENINIFNQTYRAISLLTSSYNILNNINLFNNNNVISNGIYGISLSSSSYNTINNSNIQNNGNFGIWVAGDYNIINNSTINNNEQYGIVIIGQNNILNDVFAINNVGADILTKDHNTKIYGNIITKKTNKNSFLIGGNELESIGFSEGNITVFANNIRSWDFQQNVLNLDTNKYLSPWTTMLRGRDPSRPVTGSIEFSIGQLMPTQVPIIYYSGNELLTDNNGKKSRFYPNKFIASNIEKQNIFIDIDKEYSNSSDKNRKISIQCSEATDYYITGDITQDYHGNCIGQQTIDLTLNGSSEGEKNIIIQTRTDPKQKNHKHIYTYLDDSVPIAPLLGNISWISEDKKEIEFFWNKSYDNGSKVIGYYYELSESPTFDNIIYSGFIEYNTLNVKNNDTINHIYIRVKSIDISGKESEWLVFGDNIDNIMSENNITINKYLSPQNYYTSQRNEYDCLNTGDTKIYILKTHPIESEYVFDFDHLVENSIYILEDGNYIIDESISFDKKCVVLAGKEENNTQILSNNKLPTVISLIHTKNNIIENLQINGEQTTTGSTHAKTAAGIYGIGANTNSFYGLDLFGLQYGSFFYSASTNNILNYMICYRNSHCIYLYWGSSHNAINNLIIFNSANGPHSRGGKFNTFNNILSINNNVGLGFSYSSERNVINNSILANNKNYGITSESTVDYDILSNIRLLNNGIMDIETINNQRKYYNYIAGNTIANSVVVGGNEFGSLGRSPGYRENIDETQIINNSINILGNRYLRPRSNILQGQNTIRRKTSNPLIMSFGNDIIKQSQPVIRSGSELIHYGKEGELRNSEYFIGSKTKATIINTEIDKFITEGSDLTRTIDLFLSGNGELNYIISGEILQTVSGSFSGSQSIPITISAETDGLKNIVVQVRSGNENPTHYQTVTFIDSEPPTTPLPIQPLQHHTGYANFVFANIDFERSESVDYGIGMSGYVLEISDQNDFSNIIYKHTLYDTTQTVALKAGSYFWRVTAFDKAPKYSPYSAVRPFYVETNYIHEYDAPSIPTILHPDNNEIFNESEIDIYWSQSVDTGIGLSGYIYEISKDLLFQNIVFSGNTANTGIHKSDLAESNYFLRVFAIDYLDNISSASEHIRFTIDKTSPNIIFTGETLENNSTISSNGTNIQADIIEENLESLSRNRNGLQSSLYDSGLILMMNFDNISAIGENNSIVKDLSIYGSHGNVSGAIWTEDGKYGGAYEFNGIDSYIELEEPFKEHITISLWFKIDSNLNERVLLANETYSNILDTLTLSQGAIVYNVNYQEYTAKTINDSFNDNQRHNLILDTENKKLYVDGKLQDMTGSSMHRVAGKPTIGARYYQGVYSQNFSGLIDELRIYNRALSTGEIEQLYKTNLNKISDNQWNFTSTQTCLPDGNYFYELIAKDKYYNTTKSRNFTVNLPAPTIGTPSQGLNISGISASILEQTKEFDFTGVDNTFRVYDTKGYTGWYTTISLSGDLTNQDSTQSIDKENVFFKAQNKILTLEGVESDSILISEGISTYKAMTGVITYMFKELNDECNSCIVGKYANNPSIKLNIPAFQKADTYHGTMIFTLYD